MKKSVRRLATQLTPQHYDLSIAQDSTHHSFSGDVTLRATLLKPSRTVTLHADALEINSAYINDTPADVTYNIKAQEVTLSTATECAGEVVLKASFTGVITEQMHGLYPCNFEHDGQQKQLLATQFESHHAREVFPCIDEPEAKATFALTITTGTADTVVSNTPIISEVIKEDKKVVAFEHTPVMSTYLLAWVSGDLQYQQATTSNGVLVKVYSTPVHAGKTGFALDVACRALDYMDDYFAIPYPLSKCDLIALPDFASGAMENWGCITFRESALLIDENLSDLTDKQYCANVVTHELAHQWFGNLVTMRWWDDLWLNEGFASWVPYMVLNDLFPDWNYFDHFASDDLSTGLRADSLENTHPIVVEIHEPNEIRSAFDSISYDKGCSVINLLYHYIGHTAFRDGLRIYLKRHAYTNAETQDLWNAWGESSKEDVSSFMNAWTRQSGFPLIRVESDETGCTLTQQRFYINPTASKTPTRWPIPLMRTQDDREIFSTPQMRTSQLQKLNIGQSGFYRVSYEGVLLQKLKDELRSGHLNSIDALGLLSDTAEVAKAGHHSSTQTLELISALKTCENEALMSLALGELASIRTIHKSSYDPIKPFVLWLIQHNLDRLGHDRKDADSIDDELLRPSVISSASFAGHAPTISWALSLFTEADTPEDIRADIRGVVYHTAVREHGTKATHAKLLHWYTTTTIPGERTQLAGALCGFEDPSLINESLGLITTEKVRLQDSLYWIAYSLTSRYGKYQAWEWLKNNWGWIGTNFGRDKEIDYFLRYASSGFATSEHLTDYTTFFTSVDIFGSTRAYLQGVETLQWQTAWRERDERSISKWLEAWDAE
jgi:puromycin-sensitive aminopeptidase